ncbi:MAG: acyl-CoA dehydrogenase family protein [Steroidobacteraceae bacterium]
MNLLPNEEQGSVVEAIRGFLADAAPVSRFRPPAPQIGNADHLLLPRLAEMGFLGIALPETVGGAGMGIPEEVLACREFGRSLLTPAVLGVLLGAVLAADIDGELQRRLLAGAEPVGLATRAADAADDTGACYLLEAVEARWILLVDDACVALLPKSAFNIAGQRRGTDAVVSLEAAMFGDIGDGPGIRRPGGPLFDRARLAVAAYALGLAEATRDMAVDYAKTRQQFGKPIGSFQAIKHLCAEMAIRAEAAHCQVTYASLVLAGQGGGDDFQSTAAKLVAVDAALQNAAKNIQVHGAIGFTAEADAHLFLKRAHLMDQLWGDTRRQRGYMLDARFPD